MPNLHDVEAAIQSQIITAVNAVVVDGVTVAVQTAIGWPPEKVLQNNVRTNQTSVIAIYDRKMAKNSTRWNPVRISIDQVNTTLTTAISTDIIPESGTATITLGGTVTTGDAVSCILTNGSTLAQTPPDGKNIASAAAQVVTGGQLDTPSTMATALAAAINADPVMSLWVSAAAVGAVVTLTSVNGGVLNLQSYVGNTASLLREIGRRERHFQVVIWSPTSDIRTAIAASIETLLQQLETDIWLTFPDGTFGRVFNQNDFDLEDATLQDTYRHDFLFSVEYAITERDRLYSVLAPITQYALQ